MRRELPIPDDVTVSQDHLDLTVEGPEGSVTRRLWYPDVTVSLESVSTETEEGEDSEERSSSGRASGQSPRAETVDAVVVESAVSDAKTNATVGTFESHVENMFHGVTEGWTYRMEVLYSHFPMQVEVQDGDVVIRNFLGEKAPRRVPIHGDTEVEVDGEELVLTGPNIEDVGQTAADVEQLTRVQGKDQRVFQDGVYITEKPNRGAV